MSDQVKPMNRGELYMRTRKQLLALARSAGIVGRHRMTKAQLSEALAALFSASLVAPEAGDLPSSYGRSHLTLLEINPSLAHTFWELTPEDSGAVLAQLGAGSAAAVWTLRFRTVAPEDELFDVEIDPAPGNWYVHHPFDGVACWAEIGLRTPSGRFVPVCRSNSIGSLHRRLSEGSESQLSSVDERAAASGRDPAAASEVRTPNPGLASSRARSEEPQSANSNRQLEISNRQPVNSNQQSAISNQQPVMSNQQSVISHRQSPVSGRQPPVSRPQSMVPGPQSTISNRQSTNRQSAVSNPQSEQPVSSFGCGLRPPAGHLGKA